MGLSRFSTIIFTYHESSNKDIGIDNLKVMYGVSIGAGRNYAHRGIFCWIDLWDYKGPGYGLAETSSPILS